MLRALFFGLLVFEKAVGQPPDTLWTWTSSISSENYAKSVCENSDGTFMIGGYAQIGGFSNWGTLLIKLSVQGDSVWGRHYLNASSPIDIFQRGDGRHLMLVHSFRLSGITLLDPLGNLLASRDLRIGTVYGYAPCSAQEIVATGVADSQVYVTRATDHGVNLWNHSWWLGYHSGGSSIDVHPDSGYGVCASQLIVLFERPWYYVSSTLYRLTDSGDTMWTRTYSFNEFGSSCIKYLPNGSAIIAGSSSHLRGSSYRPAAAKVDPDGNLLWNRTYTLPGLCDEMILTSDGGFVLSGLGTANLYDSAFLIRCDENGDTLWTMILPEFSYHGAGRRPLNVKSTQNNGFIVVGPRVIDGEYHAYAIRLGPDPALQAFGVGKALPKFFDLKNFPNPFNPTTEIRFELQRAGIVKLTVFDLMGREVATLVNEHLSAGSHTKTFDGSSFASGVYLYRLASENFSDTKKMVLLK